jgi:hypothetical protein
MTCWSARPLPAPTNLAGLMEAASLRAIASSMSPMVQVNCNPCMRWFVHLCVQENCGDENVVAVYLGSNGAACVCRMP